MLHLDYSAIKELDKLERINIFNSITGIKPGNLVASVNNDSVSNLAVFSSVVHLGSNPPLIGFISRPSGEVRRHTYENINANKFYTINQIPLSHIKNAHYTSAKFKSSESEFIHCNFTEEWIEGFVVPFVKESQIKFGLEIKDIIPIPLNGTNLIIGEIILALINEDAIEKNGILNLEKANVVGISGLNSYYSLKKVDSFPYARVENLPNFQSQ